MMKAVLSLVVKGIMLCHIWRISGKYLLHSISRTWINEPPIRAEEFRIHKTSIDSRVGIRLCHWSWSRENVIIQFLRWLSDFCCELGFHRAFQHESTWLYVAGIDSWIDSYGLKECCRGFLDCESVGTLFVRKVAGDLRRVIFVHNDLTDDIGTYSC